MAFDHGIIKYECDASGENPGGILCAGLEIIGSKSEMCKMHKNKTENCAFWLKCCFVKSLKNIVDFCHMQGV